jgi:hypothetical protein
LDLLLAYVVLRVSFMAQILPLLSAEADNHPKLAKLNDNQDMFQRVRNPSFPIHHPSSQNLKPGITTRFDAMAS